MKLMEMKTNENEIIQYVEPILHFCIKRLNNRHDAEDLASEIMVHILSGMKKYQIDSLEKWVWRIAYNRYARFIDMRNKQNEMPCENNFEDIADDYDFVDEMFIVDEYQQVFEALHTLSAEYRNILVDYYIGQLPIKQIAKNYSLSETTVKWRLNISREKIKTRIKIGIGENKMDKVYKRINWDTDFCNGSIDSRKYLYSQIARAICEAAYEKPLTVEEISMKTGLPTMYIEDELPRLIHGDAIVKDGNKYATDFIVLRLCDKKVMETKFAPLVEDIADYFGEVFKANEAAVAKMDFYGSDFTMKRLGYIALPAILRGKVRQAKDSLDMPNGAYPPRKDGGYGWFIVIEQSDGPSNGMGMCGCNVYQQDHQDENNFRDWLCYYNLEKFFSDEINYICDWFADKNIISKAQNGIIPNDILSEDDKIRPLKANLIIKDGDNYKLNFAVFTKEQFESFRNQFGTTTEKLDKMLTELITDIHKSFKSFVPKRLDSQINQWVSCYVLNIIGFVAEELINRGVLETPGEDEKPLVNGVFSIVGEYVDV